MRTLCRVTPGLAGAAIAILGLSGLLIGEPYWRHVGHGPTWFTWATWTVMVLTGPAALLARLAASAVTIQPELYFVLEHLVWAALAILEWRLLLSTAARVSPSRWRTVLAADLSVAGALAGLASWRTRWPQVNAGESVSWGLIDRPVALFGLAVLPVLWLWAQQQFRQGPR